MTRITICNIYARGDYMKRNLNSNASFWNINQFYFISDLHGSICQNNVEFAFFIKSKNYAKNKINNLKYLLHKM